MRRTIKARLLDRPGTLNRITSTFVRRQYNIISISASPSETKDITNITFVVEVEDEQAAQRIIKQLEKQINVIHIEDITDNNVFNRELMLVKLSTADENALQDVLQNYEHHVSLLKNDRDTLYLQAYGPHQMMETLITALQKFTILDIARTGSAGL